MALSTNFTQCAPGNYPVR